MNHLFRICMALLCVMLWSGMLAGSTIIDSIVAAYERTTVLGATERERCAAFLRTLLESAGENAFSEDRQREATTAMRTERCLDEHSRLFRPAVRYTLGTSMVLRDGYLFIDIRDFNRGAYRSLVRNFNGLPASWRSETRTVVLDLRDNRGGYVDELYEIVDRFFSPLPNVRFMEPSGPAQSPYRVSTRRGELAMMQYVMLTNSSTISAAEWLVAIVCREWYEMLCNTVGQTTYGKATIQCGSAVGERAGIAVTCGEWTIQRRVALLGGTAVTTQRVHGVGIQPNVSIDLSNCGPDCILRILRALRL